MVKHVSSNIQLGLMMSGFGVSFVVCTMVSTTCRDYDPTHVLDVDDVQFPA